jgi:hypothetical protein
MPFRSVFWSISPLEPVIAAVVFGLVALPRQGGGGPTPDIPNGSGRLPGDRPSVAPWTVVAIWLDHWLPPVPRRLHPAGQARRHRHRTRCALHDG